MQTFDAQHSLRSLQSNAGRAAWATVAQEWQKVGGTLRPLSFRDGALDMMHLC